MNLFNENRLNPYKNWSYNYWIVKLVAENLKYLKQLSYYLKDILKVGANLPLIKKFIDLYEKIKNKEKINLIIKNISVTETNKEVN